MSKPSAEKPQSEKFEEAARELDCDDDEAAFDAKLGKLARTKVEPVLLPKVAKPNKVRRAKES